MEIYAKIISSLLVILIFFSGITYADNEEPLNQNFQNTVYVDDDAPSSWYDATHVKTIQEGINNASVGDHVVVYNGTYFENVVINKTVHLFGENKNQTIIDGGFIGSTIILNAEATNVENFTIQHGGEGCSPDQFAGMLIIRNNSQIRNNIIKRNSNFGFSINASNTLITGNRVYGNCGEGIFLTETSVNNTIYNNIFLDDALDNGTNIWNVSKTFQANIVDGMYIGGNYWAMYDGIDTDMDGIGDTHLPYNSSGNILHGGDYLPLLDQVTLNQSAFNRGFPIRHAIDGDWGGAQSHHHPVSFLSRIDIFVRRFGSPEFNLTVELREGSITGNLSRTIIFEPSEISTDWQWLHVNFDDFIIPSDFYYIVLPPAPSGVTTSFGYEWGYAFGNQYDDGAFWFTRDGGGLWRDLPSMYEFVFRTYGFT